MLLVLTILTIGSLTLSSRRRNASLHDYQNLWSVARIAADEWTEFDAAPAPHDGERRRRRRKNLSSLPTVVMGTTLSSCETSSLREILGETCVRNKRRRRRMENSAAGSLAFDEKRVLLDLSVSLSPEREQTKYRFKHLHSPLGK